MIQIVGANTKNYLKMFPGKRFDVKQKFALYIRFGRQGIRK